MIIDRELVLSRQQLTDGIDGIDLCLVTDLRAYRTALAGDQGIDSRRRTLAYLVQPTTETIGTRSRLDRSNLNIESLRSPAR